MARDPRRPVRRAFALSRPVAETLEDRRLLTADLIVNGNFAANANGWTTTGAFKADATYSNANSSPGYAYLAGADGTVASSNNLTGSLSQTVTIPSSATVATLSYSYKTTSEETSGFADSLSVILKNPTTGGRLGTLTVMYNSTMGAYASSSFDLSSYIGQTISISFDGQTNATAGTIFRIDDVSLQADVPGSSSAISAPTMVSPGTLTATGLPTLNTPIPLVRWNAVAGATGYGVILQKLSGTTYSTVFNSEAGTFPTPIKGTTFSSPSPLAAGTYRWQVRAFDSSGNASSYAPALYFAVNTTGYNRAVGIDISHYQTVNSWATVKTNGTTATTDDTSFVYAKATEGVTYDDPSFSSFVTGARNAGIALGGYHFARPGSNSAVSEAQHFASRLSSAGALAPGTNLIPMLDFEDTAANSTALGKVALSKWLNDFGDAFVGLTGIVPVVYTFVSYATSYLNTSVLRYPLWQAQYNTTAANPAMPITSGAPSGVSPWPSGGWAMWQYTDNRTVGGIAANTDGDVTNSDAATFLSEFALPSTTTYTVTGTLYEDANGNGTRESGEAGISGRTVFIDADGDGTLDAGEKSTTTNTSGGYSFGGMLQGNYQIRQVVPNTSTATTAAVQTFKLGTGLTNGAHDFGSRVIDATPPTLASSRFNYDHASRSITLVFSEDVGTTLADGDATLTNLTTGDTVATTFTYDAATKTATFTPSTTLANGNYRLSLATGSVADAAGNATTASIDVDFFWLAGDINRDRVTNFADLVILAQNYGGSGRTYDTGDLTGDGVVNFADLVQLAQNYNGSVTAIAPQASLVFASTKKTVKKPASSVIV